MNPSYLVPRRDQGEEIRFSPEPQRRSSSALGLCGLVVGFVLGFTCHGIFTEVTKLPPPATVEATPAPTPTPEPYPTTKAEDAAATFGVRKDLFMDVEMRRY